MGRCLGILGIIAGVISIGAAVVFLIVFLSDTEISNDFIETNFCNEDETLIREEHQTTTSDGTGTSITFFCSDNRTGEEREITGQTVMAAIGGFMVPLCCGILIVIGSASLISASVAKQALGQYSNYMGQPMTVQQPPQNLQVTFTQDSYTAEEVEERLRKLQEMLNAGTLTQEQYFNIEQELRSRQRY